VATCNQAYRTLEKDRCRALEKNVRSFQLILPYLQIFTKLNPGSATMVERDCENHIERLFVLPSMMNVRPTCDVAGCRTFEI
jgi:hypothetical protein